MFFSISFEASKSLSKRALNSVSILAITSLEVTLSLIGDKWKILIIRDLLDGTKRFSQLKKSLPGISQKVLTQNLRTMEESGLLYREVFAEVPPRVEYTLTPRGYSIKSVLDSLAQWGKDYQQDVFGV